MANSYNLRMRRIDLRRTLEAVPGLELERLQDELGSGSRLETTADVRVGNTRLRLAITWKNSLDPRFLGGIVKELKHRALGTVPVLAAPYIPPAVRRLLEHRGIGWLDWFSNLHVESGERLIHVERPVPRGAVPRAKGLAFGSTASRIAQALLEEPGRAFRLDELRRAAFVTSASTVSRALARFQARSLVEKGQAGWRVNDAASLLDAWLEARLAAQGPAVAGFFTSEAKSLVLRKLASRSLRDEVLLLLTGAAAAETLVPLLPADTIDVYLFPPSLASRIGEKEMGWVPSEKLANVRILLSSDEGPKVGASSHGRIPLVGRAQLLLDLSREGGRARQVVEALREKWQLR
jgi:hypothetical protein